MAQQKLTVVLTLEEAEALNLAADNSMCGDDQEAEAVFGNKRQAAAAERAAAKLSAAIQDAKQRPLSRKRA